MISPGDLAPDFTLPSQHGESITLSSMRAETPVLLVFFPFAFSSICTGELTELLTDAATEEVRVLAVSCDHMYALRAFADAEGYHFPVLSDFWPHGEVARAYGVFNDEVGAPDRGTVVIDIDGRVRWRQVEPIGRAREPQTYREALAAVR